MIYILLAVLLDFILGDPYSFPHPVKLMGHIIAFEDRLARKITRTERGLKIAGGLIVLINISLGFFLPFYLLKFLSPYKIFYNLVNIYLIYTCLAARSLHYEAGKVKEALGKGLEEGRIRVGYIVGRDTSSLNEEEIIKATIETVAENTSDGVIAPLLFIFILGAPGGLMYKFVNTMDSMLGYMDDKYKDLGYFPANVDDVFNYIPARITGLLMCLSSLESNKVREGLRILKRDKRNHKSPNAGYPEAATAGLLGIQLGGSNVYHGLLVHKPTIGDNLNPISITHIMDAVRIMYKTEIFTLFIYLVIGISLR